MGVIYEIENLTFDGVNNIPVDTGWKPPFATSWSIEFFMTVVEEANTNVTYPDIHGCQDSVHSCYFGQQYGTSRGMTCRVDKPAHSTLNTLEYGLGLKHTMLVYDAIAHTYTVYNDCQSQGTVSTTFDADLTESFTLGGINGQSSLYAPRNHVKRFRIFDTALSLNEVIAEFVDTTDRYNLQRICPAGDSITTDNVGWIPIMRVLVDTDKVYFTNSGKGGTTAQSYIDGGWWDTNKLMNPSVTMIGFGTNDIGYGVTQPVFKSYLRQYCDYYITQGIPIIMLTPIVTKQFVDDVITVPNLDNYAASCREIAEEYGIPVVDLAVLSREYFNSIGKEATMLLSKYDTVHFNDAGALVISNMILSEFDRLGIKHVGRIFQPPKNIVKAGSSAIQDKYRRYICLS